MKGLTQIHKMRILFLVKAQSWGCRSRSNSAGSGNDRFFLGNARWMTVGEHRGVREWLHVWNVETSMLRTWLHGACAMTSNTSSKSSEWGRLARMKAQEIPRPIGFSRRRSHR
jgi:hypothetical protein